MTLRWEASVITQRIIDIIATAHKPSDVKEVYYGEQARIPLMPSVCVIPGTRVRDFNQTGIQYEIVVTTYIHVYHAQIADLQDIYKGTDELVESIEATILSYRKLEGANNDPIVVHGRIASVEPGFAPRGDALFVVHRMTHEAISRHLVNAQ